MLALELIKSLIQVKHYRWLLACASIYELPSNISISISTMGYNHNFREGFHLNPPNPPHSHKKFESLLVREKWPKYTILYPKNSISQMWTLEVCMIWEYSSTAHVLAQKLLDQMNCKIKKNILPSLNYTLAEFERIK